MKNRNEVAPDEIRARATTTRMSENGPAQFFLKPGTTDAYSSLAIWVLTQIHSSW